MQSRSKLLLGNLAPLVFVVGSACTDEVDNTPPITDAGLHEASPSDAALGIGLPCASDNDCSTGTCILTFPGGYCSIMGCAPANGALCPPDAVCLGGGGVKNTLCF